jgi:hypothetical protein
VNLEQLALLAEFGDDSAAVARITAAIREGGSGAHVAEQIRRERADAAEHERITGQLRADGYEISVRVRSPGPARILAPHRTW